MKKFEEIESWVLAKDLFMEIYPIAKLLWNKKEFFLADQIKRANVSIMANIAEGFARSSDKDFARFLYMAKGSASELQNYLYILLELDFINDSVFDDLYEKIEMIQKKIQSFINYLNK